MLSVSQISKSYAMNTVLQDVSFTLNPGERLGLIGPNGSGKTTLLLDEPVNHLDIPSRLRFEEALSGLNGTILVVSHDRYFIQGYASEIWEISLDNQPPTIVTWIP